MPCFIERVGRARFSVQSGTPIIVSREGPRDEAIREAAQQFADQLGARIGHTRTTGITSIRIGRRRQTATTRTCSGDETWPQGPGLRPQGWGKV